MKFVNIYLLW